MNKQSKFEVQNKMYREPYHYYTSLQPFRLHKYLAWGLEYISYQKVILDILKEIKFSNLIDVGCGDGYFINNVSSFFSLSDFKGIDLSDKAISFANAYNCSGNVVFSHTDVADVNEKYDVVTSVEVLEHIPGESINTFVNNIDNILNEEGSFVVCVPTTNQPVSRKHYRHYDLSLLNEQVGDKFVSKDVYYVYDNKSFVFRLIKKMIINRFFILNDANILNFLYKMAERFFYTSKLRGLHLIVVYKKRNRK